MDFSWSAMWVLWHIPSTREEYISPQYVYRIMGVMCVSPLPHNYECTYVQHLAEYLWTYFSEDTGIPVYWICHMDPIKYVRTYDFKLFSSWSDICNICLAFWTECDGNSSTSFFKIGLYLIKRRESTRLQTFLLCVVQNEIASPTACDQS